MRGQALLKYTKFSFWEENYKKLLWGLRNEGIFSFSMGQTFNLKARFVSSQTQITDDIIKWSSFDE
jgi:hypothetical protein